MAISPRSESLLLTRRTGIRFTAPEVLADYYITEGTSYYYKVLARKGFDEELLTTQLSESKYIDVVAAAKMRKKIEEIKGEIKMSNVWVVTVRTSIQGESNREDYLKKTVKVFDSFEKGRKYFRSVIKKYAFSKNSIFDGNGIIKKLNQHKNTIQSYSEDDELNQYLSEDALLNYKDHNEYFVDNVTKIENALSNAFSGKNVQLDFDEPFFVCDGGSVAFEVEGKKLSFYGWDDGPCNSFDPIIATNMFSMEEEKDYYLYIDDLFGEVYRDDEDVLGHLEDNVLFVDLVKAKIQ